MKAAPGRRPRSAERRVEQRPGAPCSLAVTSISLLRRREGDGPTGTEGTALIEGMAASDKLLYKAAEHENATPIRLPHMRRHELPRCNRPGRRGCAVANRPASLHRLHRGLRWRQRLAQRRVRAGARLRGPCSRDERIGDEPGCRAQGESCAAACRAERPSVWHRTNG